MKKVLGIIILIILVHPDIAMANVACNDGTTSPSCTACHKGCCSHHGGCASSSSSTNSSSNSKSSSTNVITKQTIKGCTDSSANNYNSSANEDDGSCTYDVYGCTDTNAKNYNPMANKSDSSCEYKEIIFEDNKESESEKEDTNSIGTTLLVSLLGGVLIYLKHLKVRK